MCRPCEAADAPGAVKVVWQLVDEYTLMEAERAMLKLLRGLDKHLQHLRQAAAGPNASESPDAEPQTVNRLSLHMRSQTNTTACLGFTQPSLCMRMVRP